MLPTLRSLRPLVRAALPLVAVVVLFAGAGRADAGCGDHVIILKAAGDSLTTDTPADPPKQTPCHGPNCKSAPVDHAPMPAPAGVQLKPSKDLFVPSELPAHAGLLLGDPFEFPSARPIDRATSIFHPPRG
jgi:hypothetical protein